VEAAQPEKGKRLPANSEINVKVVFIPGSENLRPKLTHDGRLVIGGEGLLLAQVFQVWPFDPALLSHQ
jgi:hypothetical protein